MSDKKDELELDLTDDKKPEEQEEIVVKSEEESAPVEEPAKPQESVEDALAKLRANLESERNARIEAEKRAREHAQLAQTSQKQADDSNLTLVANAVSTVKREAEILKANYRAALANGDYDAAADAQEQMALNAAKLLQLENGKAAMEAELKQRQDVRPMPRTADPVEAFASQLSPKSADWVRRNPQFVTDTRLNQKMIAAHNLAMADGIQADTDEYFSFVEGILKPNQTQSQSQQAQVQPQESSLSSASAPTQRRSGPPAAPVSRSGTGDGKKVNSVTLSAAEKEMADMMGMSHTDYAKNKLLLQKEGKLH